MHSPRSLLLITALCLLPATAPRACTTLVLEDGGGLYFARNLDWYWEDGLVIVNQRQLHKRALLIAGGKPAEWTVRYGSVTFNQMGQDMPFGGMNEAGLVIENMMLYPTVYPERDDRPEVNLLQWIQYHLDTCRTVDEVIAAADQVRPEPPVFRARIHYLLCDASGAAATIEFLDGKRVVHHGANLPERVLSNSPYAASVGFLERWKQEGADPADVTGPGSLERFARAARLAEDFKGDTPRARIDQAFAALEDVRQEDTTVWSVVYEPKTLRIHFRTRSAPSVKIIDFSSLDFTCGKPPQYAGMADAVGAGAAPNFDRLTPERHGAYLDRFFREESFIATIGDMRPLAAGILGMAQGFRCEPAAAPAAASAR
ncbi:MAG: linear amide C-N hydrolase [Verrucomicrobiales bacterium]|nr:linear amide C-N hydrolase [Verrucomicrobiales bacterium]